ncbi:MAG: Uncharacterized protein FD167_355 [bacterium]|nr:MAG: Uncharacterized protein FD167_355 [bacterium]
MSTKRITSEKFEEAEEQIKKLQIPYEYDTKEYPIEVLLFKFRSSDPESSTIIIPNYQREFIWSDYMKSKYIESLLLGVPIQPLVAAILDEDGTLELIGGTQRLRTIEAFVEDEFKLTKLKKLTTLNNLYYSDFPSAIKNKFKLINIRLHVVNEKADLSIRQDIFERINTTGEPANPSEIRKGSFSGKFYAFIIECAKKELFNKLCPITQNAKKRGEAEELILRFFTYSDRGTDNKEKGRRIVDDYIVEQNERGFDQNAKKKEFEQMLSFVDKYFEIGFRKTLTSNATPRVRFEAISLGVHFALKAKPDLVPTYMDWLDSKEFDDVTTSDSSGNKGRLTDRVSFVRDCLLNKIKQNELTYEKS